MTRPAAEGVVVEPEDEVPVQELHALWRKPWYPPAAALAASGFDVLVIDPDARQDETYHTGRAGDGAIRVVAHPALGWTVQVHQCLPEDSTEEFGDDSGEEP